MSSFAKHKKRMDGKPLHLIFILTGFLIGNVEGRREKDGGLNVRLELPKYPKVGESVVLGCKYNLPTDLYTVKWYKGSGEFYRFTPKELPAIKIFQFPEVDERYSNATHVFLRRVDLNMSGKYSCEVTTDAPDFTTDLKTEFLNVVALPAMKPELTKMKTRYAVGEFLNITCSAFRSRPAANLTWYINNRPAHLEVSQKQERHRERDNFESSSLNLGFLIKGIHFINGRMILRCYATLYDRYAQSTELTLLEEVKPRISSVVDNSSSSQSNPHSKNSGHYISISLLKRYYWEWSLINISPFNILPLLIIHLLYFRQ